MLSGHRAIRSHWLATAICLALLTACAAGSAALGEITRIFSVESRMNGDIASGGDDIRPGAVLTTDETGVMEFELSATGVACRLSQTAEVTVSDGGTHPLRYANGTAVCRVTRPRGDPLVLEAGEQTLEVERSVFRVKFDPDGSQRIAVLRGAMVLRAPPGPVEEAPDGQEDGTEGPLPTTEQRFRLRTGDEMRLNDGTVRLADLRLREWEVTELAAARLFSDELARFERELGIAMPDSPPPSIDVPAASEMTPDSEPGDAPAEQPTEPVEGGDGTQDDRSSEDVDGSADQTGDGADQTDVSPGDSDAGTAEGNVDADGPNGAGAQNPDAPAAAGGAEAPPVAP